jgi:hypothetical protein
MSPIQESKKGLTRSWQAVTEREDRKATRVLKISEDATSRKVCLRGVVSLMAWPMITHHADSELCSPISNRYISRSRFELSTSSNHLAIDD